MGLPNTGPSLIFNGTTNPGLVPGLPIQYPAGAYLDSTGSWTTPGAAAGVNSVIAGTNITVSSAQGNVTISSSGTGVTSTSVVTANGVSGSVATATTTPAITLTLGAITPTSVNGVTVTGSGTAAFGSGGTVAYVANNLSVFAATSSAQFAGVCSDETGTGLLVFNTSPTLVTPTLGAATATTINKVTITAPASSATLTIANGKTTTQNNSITYAGTDGTTITFQATDTYVGRATTDTLTNKTYDTAGSGNAFKINGTQVTTLGANMSIVSGALTSSGGGGGGTGNSMTLAVTQANSFLIGACVYDSNGTWTLSDNGAIGSAYVGGVVTTTGNPFTITLGGYENTITGLTANLQYYLGSSGVLTSTAPTSTSAFVVPVLRTGVAGDGIVEIGNPASLALISGANIQTQLSITSDAGGLKLVNDLATPGNSMLYGTGPTGTLGWFAQASSSGTVTHTAGALTLNSLVLGNGTADTKISTGFTTDGISVITLGTSGGAAPKLTFNNATSGTVSLAPATGALNSFAVAIPNVAANDTMAVLATAQTFSATQTFSSTNTNFSGTTASSSATTGTVTIGNGTAATNVGIGGGLIYVGGTTTATTSTAGAVVVGNGTASTTTAIGGGNIYTGGVIHSNGAVTATLSNSAAQNLVIASNTNNGNPGGAYLEAINSTHTVLLGISGSGNLGSVISGTPPSPTGESAALYTSSAVPIYMGSGNSYWFGLDPTLGIRIANTYTAIGTTGAVTINKPAGVANIAGAGTSVVVTNSLVTAASIIFCFLQTSDTTAVLGSAVAGSGSFTINMKTAPTGAIAIGWFIVN